jgi:hypothetical protein
MSIVRIVVKGLRSRNFARTGERSDPIVARYLVTGVSFDRTVAIYVATGAISGGIDVTRDTEKRGIGNREHRFSGSPFPLLPRFSVTLLYW